MLATQATEAGLYLAKFVKGPNLGKSGVVHLHGVSPNLKATAFRLNPANPSATKDVPLDTIELLAAIASPGPEFLE